MIQSFADWLIYGLVGLDPTSSIGEALNFFVYDSIKVLFLIFVISAFMGVINAYFPVERLKSFLSSHKLYGLQYLLASVFGAITPFCTCSSIPLFIGFVRGGIPLGVTLSFLITSPLVNEVAVAIFIGTFGLKVTAIYAISGILLGTLGGLVLGKFKLERYLSPWIVKMQQMQIDEDNIWLKEKTPFVEKIPAILEDAYCIVKDVIVYVLVGLAIGAGIHGYVPQDFFAEFMQKAGVWGVPASVLIAVPMYANASGIVPVIEVFVSKGIPLGTALAFMMSVVGLSLPEATMLKKVMTWKLIAIFFGSVAFMITILGWFFNAIL